MRTNRPRKQRPQGLQVVGPGFYLWDTEPGEALRLAAELSRRPMLRTVRARRARELRGPAA
jgi:hypothetical protein